jgi:hypothetical protein
MVNKLNVLQIHQPDQNAAGSFLAAIPTKKNTKLDSQAKGKPILISMFLHQLQ